MSSFVFLTIEVTVKVAKPEHFFFFFEIKGFFLLFFFVDFFFLSN